MRTLITNCVLVDQTHPLHKCQVNILVKDDVIESITQEPCTDYDTVIDAKGGYVSPGWIDIHVHCFQDTTDLGVEADRIGVKTGVVCVIDAGSSGSDTIDTFYNQVKDKQTIVKAWINIAKSGLIDRFELKDPDNVDIDATIAKIHAYDDFVVGIKVRASGSVMGEDTVTPFLKAHTVSNTTNRPIMVHFGNNPPTIHEVLKQMREDDVLTHCFHGKPNNILDGLHIKDLVLDKRKEGVLYDVGHGQDSFSFTIAKQAMSNNFEPDSISTDIHKYNVETPVGSLAGVMTKFLNMGYSLENVVHLVTLGAANNAKLKGFGMLKDGVKAHLTFFEVATVDTTAVDSNNESIQIHKQITPKGCMISGVYTEVH